jgi:hypothetical protein
MGKKNASASALAPGSSPAPTPAPAPVTIPGSKGVSVSSIKTEQGNLASDPLPNVKVNSAHLQEIKSALDDAVKKVSLDPSYTTSYCILHFPLSTLLSSLLLDPNSAVFVLSRTMY